jgi:hypothetical protein
MLKDLLHALGEHKIIIHIDKTSDRELFLEVLGKLPDNVDVLPRQKSFRIDWAGWHMVDAELALFAAAATYLTEQDHAILLSGVCYPCRPVTEFIEFLHENKGRELITYNRLATTNNLKNISTRSGTWRVKHLFISDILVPPIKTVVKFAFLSFKFINKLKLPNLRFESSLDYYVGSQWIGCTKNFIEVLLNNKKEIRKKFRWTFAPDEIAIQSFCVWASREYPDLKSAYSMNNDVYAVIAAPFHYIRGGSIGVTCENLNEITESRKYFVRKPNAELRLQLKKLIS